MGAKRSLDEFVAELRPILRVQGGTKRSDADFSWFTTELHWFLHFLDIPPKELQSLLQRAVGEGKLQPEEIFSD